MKKPCERCTKISAPSTTRRFASAAQRVQSPRIIMSPPMPWARMVNHAATTGRGTPILALKAAAPVGV
jgi:hypothetical protein